MRRASHLVSLFALFVLIAAVRPASSAAPAQQGAKVYFEVLKHLDDFQEHYLGDHSSLYDFRPFTSRSKNWISAGELQELRAAWARERERVAKEIERLAADPVARSLHRVRRGIDKNVYFSEIDKHWVDTFAPFYYVVQRPPKEEPGYYERKATDYARWSQALFEVFREEYVEPLGLQRRPDHEVFVTAVLSSEGAYSDYGLRNKAELLPGQRAHYDSRLRAAVTYEPWAGGQKDADERRHALMHELVHAFQHAYSAGSEGLLPHPWLNEGFAEYLSSGSGDKPESLRARKLDQGARKLIADILKDPRARDVYLLPLEDLLEAKSYYDVVVRTWARARGRELSGELALSAFYRQSYLLVYYLEREGGERHKAAFREYLRSYFKGRGDRASFEQAFKGLDLGELESRYLGWIDAAAKGWRPPRLPAAEPVASGGAASAPPSYDPAALRPDLADPELCLALSVWEVFDGRPEAARERLSSVATGLDPADGRRARLARELERVEGWIDLRNRFIAWLAAEDRSLMLELGGKRVRAKVLGARDGQLLLGENRQKLERLPLSELDPALLIREMKDRSFEYHWTRTYMDVLGGREHWERRLPKDDPAADALREDAGSYGELLLQGELLERLDRLAAAPLPVDAAAAEALLAEIGTVLAAGADGAVVRAASAALRPLALLCATRAVEGAELDALFAGVVEKLGERRVRISYAFKDARELADFQRFEKLDGLEDLGVAVGEARFTVGSGGLGVTGRGGLRHVAHFEGAQVLRYGVRYAQAGSPIWLALGICDDGRGSWLLGTGVHSVVVRDRALGDLRAVGTPGQVELERTYAMELRHDGEQHFEALRDGGSIARLGACGRPTGAVVLAFETTPRVEIRNLSVEGTLSEDSLARARAAAARRRVEALGL